jgi:hypothetical protein
MSCDKRQLSTVLLEPPAMIEERRLWLAVLELAIMDLRNRKERPALRYLTELWFTSNNHKPGSFLWVCDSLNLDPSWLRRRLFAIVDRPVLKCGHFKERSENRKKSGPPVRSAFTIAPGLTISP